MVSAASWAQSALKHLHKEEVPPLAVFSRGRDRELTLAREGRVENASKVSTLLSTEDTFPELLGMV